MIIISSQWGENIGYASCVKFGKNKLFSRFDLWQIVHRLHIFINIVEIRFPHLLVFVLFYCLIGCRPCRYGHLILIILIYSFKLFVHLILQNEISLLYIPVSIRTIYNLKKCICRYLPFFNDQSQSKIIFKNHENTMIVKNV